MEEIVGGIFLAIMAALLWAVLIVWPVMILIGMLHSELPQIPATGLGTTMIICVLASLLTAKSNTD